MANIKVNDIKSARADIKPVSAELFEDSESFINDLEDNELTVAGGSQGSQCTSNLTLTLDNCCSCSEILTK